jgi:hypothetical protein
MSVPTATTVPFPYQIINHERPNLQVDFSPFKDFGCNFSPSWNEYSCEKDSLLYTLGCTYIEEMPLLGGLTPEYPIATCILEINEDSFVADIPDSCLYYNGGFVTYCYRYVVYKDQGYQLVEGVEGFRTLYAPVDSPEEALSFVLATDDYFASYGQTKQDNYVYSVQELEDTFVEVTTDGYLVHVFSYPDRGCGPFETKAVELKVTFDGYVSEVNRFPVYRDPSEDDMCVD